MTNAASVNIPKIQIVISKYYFPIVGSLEKWIIWVLEQEMSKMILKYLILENNETTKDCWSLSKGFRSQIDEVPTSQKVA